MPKMCPADCYFVLSTLWPYLAATNDPRYRAGLTAGAVELVVPLVLPGASPPDLSENDHERLTDEALNYGDSARPCSARTAKLAPSPASSRLERWRQRIFTSTARILSMISKEVCCFDATCTRCLTGG
jgi:hypothetical protein